MSVPSVQTAEAGKQQAAGRQARMNRCTAAAAAAAGAQQQQWRILYRPNSSNSSKQTASCVSSAVCCQEYLGLVSTFKRQEALLYQCMPVPLPITTFVLCFICGLPAGVPGVGVHV
jgi:hypothetical protein